MRPIGTAEDLERRRRRAVDLVKQGESPAKVAYCLGCGRSSVYTWVKLDREAAEKLAARPHAGPMPRLTDEQVKKLEGLLLQGARAHGWPNDLRSAHRVNEMIRRHFGVAYHVEHVRKVAGIDHVGIGSDFDGIDKGPRGLEDVSRYPYLFAELARRGWTDEELEKLAGLNILRVMRKAEEVSRRLQASRPASTATIEQLDGAAAR